MGDFWALHDVMLKQEIKNNQERPKRIAAESLDIIARNSALLQHNSTRNGKHQPMILPRTKSKELKVDCIAGQELFIGDYITAYGETWVVIEAKTDEHDLRTGKAWLCNFNLCFQNGTSKILEYKCVIDDGSYSSRQNNQIQTEQGSYKIYVPLNEDTEQIFLDKRFALNKTYKGIDGKPEPTLSVIKVVWIDKTSGNIGEGSHLLQMRTEKDVYVPAKDDFEKMICDYIKGDETDLPTEPESPEDPTLLGQCIITGSSSIRLGSPRNYTVSVVDENGDLVDTSGDVILWEYDAIDGVLFVSANNVLSINADVKRMELIGQDITIKAVDSAGNYAKATFMIEVI